MIQKAKIINWTSVQKGGDALYVWLIHFAVQQKLNNTVKQLYYNKK